MWFHAHAVGDSLESSFAGMKKKKKKPVIFFMYYLFMNIAETWSKSSIIWPQKMWIIFAVLLFQVETDFLNEEHGDGGEEHGDGKRLSPVKGQPLCCILLCR